MITANWVLFFVMLFAWSNAAPIKTTKAQHDAENAKALAFWEGIQKNLTNFAKAHTAQTGPEKRERDENINIKRSPRADKQDGKAFAFWMGIQQNLPDPQDSNGGQTTPEKRERDENISIKRSVRGSLKKRERDENINIKRFTYRRSPQSDSGSNARIDPKSSPPGLSDTGCKEFDATADQPGDEVKKAACELAAKASKFFISGMASTQPFSRDADKANANNSVMINKAVIDPNFFKTMLTAMASLTDGLPFGKPFGNIDVTPS